QRSMLSASSALAHGYLDKEAAERCVTELIQKRDQGRQERAELANLAQTVRSEWQVQQEHIHSRELEASDLRHRRDALAQRLREDYQVNLAEMYQQSFGRESSANADVSVDEDHEGCHAFAVTGEGISQSPNPRESMPPMDATAANEEIDELRR